MPKVAMFIPCFVDQLKPQVGLDMARAARAGYEVKFPEGQTCCGQPRSIGLLERRASAGRAFPARFRRSGNDRLALRLLHHDGAQFLPELLEKTPLHDEARGDCGSACSNFPNFW